jgi:hypothetical protein
MASSDFDHGFVGDIHDIDNDFFIVDNGHSFVDMHR